MTKTTMQFKFVGKISNMGDNLVIWIPKEFHKEVKAFRGKQLKIFITDEI
ncbi:MAG: hypothetical protein ACE5J2_03950 [Nitrososphaerales archaeon]